MSWLVQTVSSYSQGAQCIPVRKKRGCGEGPAPQPPRLLRGTGDNPDLQCDLCSQASPLPNWRHPTHSPVSLPWDLPSCTWSPIPRMKGNSFPRSHPSENHGGRGVGGSDAFPMVQAGREADLGHSPAKTSQRSTNRCQAEAGRDPGVEVTAGRPQVSRGFWHWGPPWYHGLCFPVPSSPEG